MATIKKKSILTFIWLIFAIGGFAQDYEQVTEINVFKDGRKLLSPWTGGINAPQIGEADFNNDGRTDLFTYDEDGEWKFVFIHLEDDTYVYEPSYADGVPNIQDWFLMTDYNCDGITDLMTHGNLGAPRTYTGSYDDGRLVFTADKNIIYYESSTGFSINLYTIGTHRPLFKDINGDGDKDVLSFDVSLFRIYYYENQRIENNIPCDSLYFKRIDRCWGNVKETGITLDMSIGDTCDFRFFRQGPELGETVLHPGGTCLEIYDEDNNGVFDLLLSDATFERINYLRNNGDVAVSNLYTQDDSFPSYDQPVDMALFPAPYILDVDKDGDDDLLAAPFNAGAIDNYENIWYYKNNGSNFEPFRFEQNNFLVGDMIDVGETADPAFFDYNDDGLQDIVIGNGGYFEGAGNYLFSLTLFENTGTASLPQYTFIDRNYLNINALGLDDITPFFADINGNNYADLFAGELGGRILIMDNGDGIFGNARFLKDNTNTDIDVGQSSNPVLHDFDGNGTLDLIIGNRDGDLAYYENTGTVNIAEFTFRTDTLGGVQSHPANGLLRYSSPALGDFDNDGKQDLLLGGADVWVKFYSDIGSDPMAIFTETHENFFGAKKLTISGSDLRPRANPAVADISLDGLPEVILGTNTGGLLLHSQDLADTANTTNTSSSTNLINDSIGSLA